MSAIRTVLVTTDFSDTSRTAFALARDVAERFQAQLLVLYVQELQAPLLVVEYAGAGMAALEREHGERARDRLAELARELGENVGTVVVPGTPHLEIVRIAEERKVDLIVMATHGRGFFSHAILGSTTERVLRRAPCPVLVVREAATKHAGS